MPTTVESSEWLQSAIGQPCWSVMAGGEDGFAVVIDLGAQQRRRLRLSNPALTFVQRTFEGEYSFLIECPWRLDAPSGVVASSAAAAAERDATVRRLSVIDGATLDAVSVLHTGGDLVLAFSTGHHFIAFAIPPDQVGRPRTARPLWSFWCPSGSVIVDRAHRRVAESRREADRALSRLKLTLKGEEESVVDRLQKKRRTTDAEEAASALQEPAPGPATKPATKPVTKLRTVRPTGKSSAPKTVTKGSRGKKNGKRGGGDKSRRK